MKQIPSFFLLLPLLSFPAFSSANNIRIETLFDPPSITLSNTSTYKIIVHGSQQGPVGTLPVIDGLNFSNTPRTLRSASFINGVPSIRFELSFAVTPQKEGTFSVPNWQLDVDGKSFQAPATKLLVLPPNQVDKIRQAEKNKQEKDLKQAAFLEFSCPRPFLFK
ncbi:BatD family protein, partial [bacterium]|nr:BatD family protein [bacterium]